MSLIVACNTVVPWKCVSSRFLTAPSLEIRVRRLVYWKRKKRIIFEAISCMFPVFSVSRGTQGKTLKAHGPLGREFSAKAPPFEMSSVSLAHPLQTHRLLSTSLRWHGSVWRTLTVDAPSVWKALWNILAQLCPCHSHFRSRWLWRSVSNHTTSRDN